MKKYLMTALTAVALSGLFTGCSKEMETNGETTAEADIIQTYENAFITRFGQPHENQTWGFGSVAGTRVENANANEWADPNKAYGGLKVPPPLTDAQKAVVIEYFQTVRNPTYEDPHWTNYFIQQVYKGHTAPREGYSPEAYLAANGSTYLYASDYMDHLAAIDGDFVDHINNFNHGDCSTNETVLDNGGNANDGPFHSDKIMYMKESTTASFGYYNSNGSVRRTEYTGLVGFQTIINVLGSKANCLNDGWNRSFMGFDFEQMVGDEIYAKIGWGDNANDWAYYEYGGQKYHYLSSNMNMYCGDLKEYNDLNGVNIAKLLSDGYLPVAGSADKKWVKVGGCADGYYSDWIVTLTKANTGNTPPPPPSGFVCRIIAEDLTVGENSDFDFNDVVFDVIDNGATIRLRAAGGELPLYVAGQEVHDALMRIDNNILKLDTVDPIYINKVDHPQGTYDVNAIIERLKAFHGHVIIQTMFMRGDCHGESVDNTSETFVAPWLEAVKEIRPQQVMIYTIDRETPTQGLLKATHKQLDAIRDRVIAEGIPCTASY